MLMMHVDLLLLLLVANGIPVLLDDLLGRRFAIPLDFGIRFVDKEPLLGTSKTWRGVMLSIIGSAVIAEVLGLTWLAGAQIAFWSMLGDSFSSFCKRRMKMDSGEQALGIDQVPESLLPLLAVREQFALSAESILTMVITFFVLELFLSRILFRLHLRKRPH